MVFLDFFWVANMLFSAFSVFSNFYLNFHDFFVLLSCKNAVFQLFSVFSFLYSISVFFFSVFCIEENLSL